jgi:hypothetical protein
MRFAPCVLLVFWVILLSEAGSSAQAPPPPPPPAKLELKTTGFTDEIAYAKIDWEIKNLGMRTPHGLKPVVEIKYKGMIIPDTDYLHEFKNPNGSEVIIKPSIPIGKHKISLKIRLSDNSIIEDEIEVNFKKK